MIWKKSENRFLMISALYLTGKKTLLLVKFNLNNSSRQDAKTQRLILKHFNTGNISGKKFLVF
jgi:hypothetical protein